MINITRNKNKLHGILLHQMILLEKVFANREYFILNKQWNDSIASIENGNINITSQIMKYENEMFSLFMAQYRRVGTVFFKEAVKYINLAKNKTKNIEYKDDEGIFWSLYNPWIKNTALTKVKTIINPNTINALKKIVDKGIREGLTYKQIAKNMRKSEKILNRFRAETIAITEVHNAFSLTVDTTIKESSINTQEKEWSAALDERTREWHEAVNGERIPIDEMFIVNNESMQYPGDSNASAENIVRCRCVCLYYTENAKKIFLPYTIFNLKGVYNG